jgi:hypothetical protein
MVFGEMEAMFTPLDVSGFAEKTRRPGEIPGLLFR